MLARFLSKDILARGHMYLIIIGILKLWIVKYFTVYSTLLLINSAFNSYCRKPMP